MSHSYDHITDILEKTVRLSQGKFADIQESSRKELYVKRVKRGFDFSKEWWPDIIGGLLLIIGIATFLSEYFGWSNLYIPVLSDFFLRIWPELIGIGLAVILIDRANKKIRESEEKKRLILQMGSSDNSFALEAVRQLRSRGWLLDGSLHEADLMNADLRGAILWCANLQEADLMEAILNGATLWAVNLQAAELYGANLQEAILVGANLKKTFLEGANLQEANLMDANLQKALLYGANLQGANLENANIQGADLWGANLTGTNVTSDQLASASSIDGATMPDGSKYEEEDSDDDEYEQKHTD